MSKGNIVKVNFNGIVREGIIEEICANGVLVKVMGYYVFCHEIENGVFVNMMKLML